MIKMSLEPHCKTIFLRMQVAVTSLLRDKLATILASLSLCIFTVLYISHIIIIKNTYIIRWINWEKVH
jgi:hypothetical protein